jgi:hypothetical protein
MIKRLISNLVLVKADVYFLFGWKVVFHVSD